LETYFVAFKKSLDTVFDKKRKRKKEKRLV